MSSNFCEAFENIRKIHQATSSIHEKATDSEKRGALSDIIFNTFELMMKLNETFANLAENCKESTGATMNQIALLAQMTNCCINLTHFLNDNHLSKDEYVQVIESLTLIGEQATKTHFEDSKNISGSIQQINSAFIGIRTLLNNVS